MGGSGSNSSGGGEPSVTWGRRAIALAVCPLWSSTWIVTSASRPSRCAVDRHPGGDSPRGIILPRPSPPTESLVRPDVRLPSSVLTTNTRLSAAQVATTYKFQWREERAFRTEESVPAVSPIYHNSDLHSFGYIVACVLALRLEVELQHRLDEKGIPVTRPDLMRDLAQNQAVRVEADAKQYRPRTALAGQARARRQPSLPRGCVRPPSPP